MVRVSARFELVRVRVNGIRLYPIKIRQKRYRPIIRGVAFVLTFIYWHNFENLKLSLTDKLYETERERTRDIMMSEHLQAGVKGRSNSHRIS